MTRPRLINSITREVFNLGIGETSMGRRPSCKIVIQDRKASAHHATITGESAGRFVIRDSGSTNGTFVNEKPIVEGCLSAGDSIRIGAVTFVFREEDEDSLSIPYASTRTLCSSTHSEPLRVTANPPLMEELVGLSLHIDRWSVLLAILPWFCSPALGAAGVNAACFRVRAKATRLPIPAWPLIALVSLWLAWLILSGWGSWLVWSMMLVGLCLVLFRFYRDNKEIWEKFDRTVLRAAALRTATFSGLIAVLLLPGIGVGWTAHELLEICFAAVEGIPRADVTKYFDEAWPAAAPPAPPPSKWRHPQQYLAYMCDPWRLLVGKAQEIRVVSRSAVSNSSINNAPERISNAALSAHHFVKFIWWLLIAQASYVAIRLYLYVFARVFVGRGGRVVMQLDFTA